MTRRFLPAVWLVLALACSAAVWWLSRDVHAILSAVYPMAMTSTSFAALVASMYVSALVVMSFLTGVFVMMLFVIRTEDEESTND